METIRTNLPVANTNNPYARFDNASQKLNVFLYVNQSASTEDILVSYSEKSDSFGDFGEISIVNNNIENSNFNKLIVLSLDFDEQQQGINQHKIIYNSENQKEVRIVKEGFDLENSSRNTTNDFSNYGIEIFETGLSRPDNEDLGPYLYYDNLNKQLSALMYVREDIVDASDLEVLFIEDSNSELTYTVEPILDASNNTFGTYKLVKLNLFLTESQ